MTAYELFALLYNVNPGDLNKEVHTLTDQGICVGNTYYSLPVVLSQTTRIPMYGHDKEK